MAAERPQFRVRLLEAQRPVRRLEEHRRLRRRGRPKGDQRDARPRLAVSIVDVRHDLSGPCLAVVDRAAGAVFEQLEHGEVEIFVHRFPGADAFLAVRQAPLGTGDLGPDHELGELRLMQPPWMRLNRADDLVEDRLVLSVEPSVGIMSPVPGSRDPEPSGRREPVLAEVILLDVTRHEHLMRGRRPILVFELDMIGEGGAAGHEPRLDPGQ